MNKPLPWYKQFWPWFVFGLPAVTVVAGITTVIISIQYADSLVADDYYKEGLAINANLRKEQLAKELELSMIFVIDPHMQRIELNLLNPQHVVLPSMLQLKLMHPADKKFDMQFPLFYDSERKLFVQQYASMQDIDWLIEIEPVYMDKQQANPAWRLRSKRSWLETDVN